MKLSSVLPFALVASGWVIPPDQDALVLEEPTGAVLEIPPSKDQLLHESDELFSTLLTNTKNKIDDAYERHNDQLLEVARSMQDEFFAAKAWVSSESEPFLHEAQVPDHGISQPFHGFSDTGKLSRKESEAPRHPGKGHHGHHKPNMTIYELISTSKYTTKLAKLINEYDDLIDYLNGTSADANITVFAPTDSAFVKIPDDAPKPSKELLKKALSYHISPGFYPAGRVLTSPTIPTLLEGSFLSESPKDTPQRLSTNIGLRGLTVNFYSRVVAIDIFATNGVIHGVDSILVPPPKAAAIIQFFPSEFSTLELGLLKTGLLPLINDTSNHLGGTLFAPSNFAFKKLGPRANGFLFSKYGQKYLKALLKYHVVANHTMYSDAFYKPEEAKGAEVPKGLFHVDLPTLLENRHLSIDVFRYGRYVNIKINGFASVTVPNGIAKDGVIHTVSNVLIPPKQVSGQTKVWEGEELNEEELKERLAPFIDDDTPRLLGDL